MMPRPCSLVCTDVSWKNENTFANVLHRHISYTVRKMYIAMNASNGMWIRKKEWESQQHWPDRYYSLVHIGNARAYTRIYEKKIASGETNSKLRLLRQHWLRLLHLAMKYCHCCIVGTALPISHFYRITDKCTKVHNKLIYNKNLRRGDATATNKKQQQQQNDSAQFNRYVTVVIRSRSSNTSQNEWRREWKWINIWINVEIVNYVRGKCTQCVSKWQ